MKRMVISSALLALAIGSTGIAAAEKPEGASNNGGFKVTGGGQIIAEGQQGAGDTVGFNAHEIEGDDTASPGPADAAKGQFQFVPRGQSGNASAPEEKFHGIVTCLLSGGEAVANENAEDDDNFNEALMEGSARFGGFLRDDPDQAFTVDVTDEGQGNAKNDMILVRLTTAPCADNPEDDDDDPEDLMRLGRGNVKIHNNPDGPSTLAAATQTAAALARLAR